VNKQDWSTGSRSSVKHPGTRVLQVDATLDLGLEGLADLVQQVGQGAIIGGLLDGRAGRADFDLVSKAGSRGFIGPHLKALCHKGRKWLRHFGLFESANFLGQNYVEGIFLSET